jgi:hypothetical protein
MQPVKKKFLIFLLFISICFASAKAIGIAIYKQPCEFLKPLHFKSGSAKVVVKASFRGFFRSPDESIVYKLSKKKYIRYKDYFSRCCGGSSISFIPESCENACEATIRKGIKFNLNSLKPGDVLFLTCIVFENFKGFDSKYFFLIDNISYKIPKN